MALTADRMLAGTSLREEVEIPAALLAGWRGDEDSHVVADVPRPHPQVDVDFAAVCSEGRHTKPMVEQDVTAVGGVQRRPGDVSLMEPRRNDRQDATA